MTDTLAFMFERWFELFDTLSEYSPVEMRRLSWSRMVNTAFLR